MDEKGLTPLDVPPKGKSPAFNETAEKVFAAVYSQEDPELPLLDERHRMFAFRWATEYRTTVEWARIFHVSDTTIDLWKRNPKILAYYMILRRKQNAVLMERMHLLETKAFEKLYEILDLEITDKNLDGVRKTIMNILGVDVEGTLNLRITAEARAEGQTPARSVVAAEGSVDLKRLRDRIDEMELLEELVDVTPRAEEVEDGQERDEGAGGAAATDEGAESD